MLIKVRAMPGEERTEVLQLVDIFRAKVNDVSDTTLTLSVAGDPGKVRREEGRRPRQGEEGGGEETPAR